MPHSSLTRPNLLDKKVRIKRGGGEQLGLG